VLLAAGKKRQGQNRLPGLILYEHHQSQIVVAAVFSQLSDCVLGIRKCRRYIRQVRAIRIILGVCARRVGRSNGSTEVMVSFRWIDDSKLGNE
jgi:hypothetical protein